MTLCSDAELETLVEAIQGNDRDDLAQVDALAARYPEDARLHFLRGSILAGRQRPIEAHAALARAVALAPDFAIARYQLGFFELTSGEVDQALSTWGPLLRLPEEHYLRHFVEGLTHLVRDEFAEAIARMQSGMALNQENPPLNNDIRLLICECEKLARGETASLPDAASDQSLTSLMLGQFGTGSTRH
jgi:tetratricopeptide (TPR) repeat protein